MDSIAFTQVVLTTFVVIILKETAIIIMAISFISTIDDYDHDEEYDDVNYKRCIDD